MGQGEESDGGHTQAGKKGWAGGRGGGGGIRRGGGDGEGEGGILAKEAGEVCWGGGMQEEE